MSEPILNFTKAAMAHLKQSIAGKSGAVGFRLGIKQTGCTGWMYVPALIESVNPDDIHQQLDGIDVYIAKDAIEALKGTKVDYIDISLGQKQLVYDNPNADSLCGCGESFNLKSETDEGAS